jgi:hypothetical protein
MASNQIFSQLLSAARSEAAPQRLVFLLARRALPAGATDGQRRGYTQGTGGALEPLGCVDKSPHELTTFDDFALEANGACPGWDLIFIAALSLGGLSTGIDARVTEAMKRMVADVQMGRVDKFLALGADGEQLRLTC